MAKRRMATIGTVNNYDAEGQIISDLSTIRITPEEHPETYRAIYGLRENVTVNAATIAALNRGKAA